MISFSSFTKRRGTSLAGVLSVALSCVLLLCGAGSVPVENLLPQGAMQGDLNAGGHNLTNAATISATTVNATHVAVSGSLTLPTGFTQTAGTITGLTSAATNSAAYLQPANNLTDVSNAATARLNLGLGSSATNSVGSLTGSTNNSAGGAVTLDSSGQSTGTLGYTPRINYPGAPNILYDTQMGSDPESTLGLTTLIALAQRGECRIIGVVSDVYSTVDAPSAAIVLNYAGMGYVPVGSFQSAPTPTQTETYASNLTGAFASSQFPGNNGETTNSNLSSVTIERQALARATNKSVIYLLGGGWSALNYLLNSPADGISPLTGAQLFSAKVTAMYCVSGYNTTGIEYNFSLDPASSVAAHATITGMSPAIPIYYYPLQMQTTFSPAVTSYAVAGSPVLLNTPTYGWNSFDAYFAVRGITWNGNTYVTETQGSQSINSSTGANTFTAGAGDDYLMAYTSGGAAQLNADLAPILQYAPDCGNSSTVNYNLSLLGINAAQPNLKDVITGASAYIPTADLIAPGMATGEYVYQSLGQGDSTKNEAAWSFYYAGAGSSANYQCWGFYGTPYYLYEFANGDVSVGSSTDPGVPFGVTGAAVITGNVTTGGEVIYSNASSCITGSGSAALGTNSPATTTTAPYKWLKMQASDGSTVYVPAWK